MIFTKYGAEVTLYDFFIANMLPATIGNIIGGAMIIGCLLYYVHDYRNRHKRALFNLAERLWKKIVDKYRARQQSNDVSAVTTSTMDVEMGCKCDITDIKV